MSIFPRPLKKVLDKIVPFSQEDKVPLFNLGSGTYDATTYLRGDGTWATPSLGTGYVPYIGATQDVDLGIYKLTADAVEFSLTSVNGPAAGQIAYDGASGALSYLLNSSNVLSRIGQTMHAYVHNAEAVTITKGQAVYLFSASGNKASVKLANNTSDATSAKTFGLAAENIGANQNGMVICQGVLDGLNTGMYTAGDTLYLGSTPGGYTNVKPYAPNHFVYVGIVERANAGNGQIYVRVQNGYELDEIHDVDLITTPPINGNVLTYNGSLWVPQAPGGGGLTVGTTSIASGTVGRILFQNGGNVLGQDSSLFWDNTNKRLGVGATPASTVRLDVRAQGALSTDIAFRVRNSADTENIFNVLGTGKTQLCKFGNGQAFAIPNTAGADGFILTTEDASVNAASFTRSHIFMTSTYVDIRAAEGGNARHVLQFSAENYGGTYRNWSLTNASLNDGALYFGVNGTTNRRMFLTNSATLNIGQDSMLNVQSGTNQLRILNGTAPTTLAADTFALYSADIVAGNAAPHFRTENGDIVKLYRVGGWGLPTGTFTRTTFDTATVTTAQLAERVAALIQDLRDNHQLLKA